MAGIISLFEVYKLHRSLTYRILQFQTRTSTFSTFGQARRVMKVYMERIEEEKFTTNLVAERGMVVTQVFRNFGLGGSKEVLAKIVSRVE